jgi:molybdenum cofactor cytidylyltransferase
VSSGIVGILLAAGAGSRFGGDKLRHPLSDGTPMALASALNLRPACDRLIAVVRPGQDALADLLTTAGCEIVFSPESTDGMGHSLAAGARAAAQASGWIVALADMPFIATTTHQAVASRLREGASLVATEYRGERGHPVGFSHAWFSQLAAMTGDQGGKSILQAHRQQLVLCAVDDPGVLRDIDRREDLDSPSPDATER